MARRIQDRIGQEEKGQGCGRDGVSYTRYSPSVHRCKEQMAVFSRSLGHECITSVIRVVDWNSCSQQLQNHSVQSTTDSSDQNHRTVWTTPFG